MCHSAQRALSPQRIHIDTYLDLRYIAKECQCQCVARLAECEHQATLLHASYSASSREIGSIVVTLEVTFRPSKEKTKGAHTVGCV